MKAKKLRDQNVEELRQLCVETGKQLFDLRTKAAMGEGGEQPLKIRTLRRELARIKTVIKEQEAR